MPDEYDSLLDSLAPKKATTDYRALYKDVGAKYNVDPDLLYRQAQHESVNFNPAVVAGRRKSPKGATGIAQFMPDTARQYGLRVGDGVDDRTDPVKAADAHGRLMRDLIDKYGDTRLALSAYNSGTNRSPESARRAMQRIPETRNYVQKLAPQGDEYDKLLDQVGKAPTDDYDKLLNQFKTPQSIPPAPRAVAPKTPKQPRQLSYAEMRQQQEYPRDLSLAELKHAEDNAQRGQPGLNVNNIDPRILKGEQPADRLAYQREGDLQSRVPSEPYRDTVARQQKEEQWRKVNQPEIDRQTELYRQDIRRTHGGDANKWLNELQGKAAGQLAEFQAGVTGSDTLRIRAEAAAKAATEEGADRNVVSRKIQDITAGFLGSAPELIGMSAGIPPVAMFGAGSGIRAAGRGDENVGAAVAQGIGTGAAFEIPGAGQGIKRLATRGLGVGAGSTAVNLASGQPLGQAAEGGLTNALMATVPEALGRRRARDNKGSEPEVQTEGKSVPENLQRFQHLQFGEVEVLPDQTGAKKGKVRVVEVDNPDQQHFVKKADLQGRGNSRMIPIKPESLTPVTETPAFDETAHETERQTALKTARDESFSLPKITEPANLNKTLDVTHETPTGRQMKRKVTVEARQKELERSQSTVTKLLDCLRV